MTVPRDSDAGRWVDGTLESGADEGAPRSDAGQESSGRRGSAPADQELNDETGVGLGMGAPSTFEPEEDAG